MTLYYAAVGKKYLTTPKAVPSAKPPPPKQVSSGKGTAQNLTGEQGRAARVRAKITATRGKGELTPEEFMAII